MFTNVKKCKRSCKGEDEVAVNSLGSQYQRRHNRIRDIVGWGSTWGRTQVVRFYLGSSPSGEVLPGLKPIFLNVLTRSDDYSTALQHINEYMFTITLQVKADD